MATRNSRSHSLRSALVKIAIRFVFFLTHVTWADTVLVTMCPVDTVFKGHVFAGFGTVLQLGNWSETVWIVWHLVLGLGIEPRSSWMSSYLTWLIIPRRAPVFMTTLARALSPRCVSILHYPQQTVTTVDPHRVWRNNPSP